MSALGRDVTIKASLTEPARDHERIKRFDEQKRPKRT
jgi:hypothetical protein